MVKLRLNNKQKQANHIRGTNEWYGRLETDSFRIHYRKTGAHIVPTYGGKL